MRIVVGLLELGRTSNVAGWKNICSISSRYSTISLGDDGSSARSAHGSDCSNFSLRQLADDLRCAPGRRPGMISLIACAWKRTTASVSIG
jgi:hypothetical protein